MTRINNTHGYKATVACSPKPDPHVMRVIGAHKGRETFDTRRECMYVEDRQEREYGFWRRHTEIVLLSCCGWD